MTRPPNDRAAGSMTGWSSVPGRSDQITCLLTDGVRACISVGVPRTDGRKAASVPFVQKIRQVWHAFGRSERWIGGDSIP